MSCTFSPGICLFNAELQLHVGFFEKNVRRAEIRGRFDRVSPQKCAKGWERFCKKGGKFFVAHQFLCSLDAELNVDFDFAIKLDLII